MLKYIMLLLAFVVAFFGVVCIYAGRNIIRRKLNKHKKNENKIVTCVKYLGYILVITGLVIIYVLTRV